MQSKRCFKCEQVLALTEFYVHPAMGDGRLNKCKQCARRDVAANYRKNIEHYVAYEHKRARTPERRRARIETAKRRKERNPLHDAARVAAQNAVRRGRLIPAPCEVCGSLKVQGHHDDYTKPLQVRWLCWTHHMAAHRKMAHSEPERTLREAG